jgi:hypothetical protein
VVTDSVHVIRVSALPDDQEAAVVCEPEGPVLIYMREEDITAAGALALQSAMDSARDAYHRAWELPAVLAS